MSTPSLNRKLYLVKGYQKHIYPPKDAYYNNLKYRFAIVLNTNYSGFDGSHFDAEYYFEMLEACISEIGYEKVLVTTNDGNGYVSIKEVKEIIFKLSEENREPPQKTLMYLKGNICALIETEFWVNFGGPFPYHDSYTIAIYTQEDISDRIQDVCVKVANKFNGEIVDIIEGDRFSLPWRPWWKKIWFFRN